MNLSTDQLYILLTFLIALFTGLSFWYQRKNTIVLKPLITEVFTEANYPKRIVVRLVNPAPYKITLINIKLKKKYLIFPIFISYLNPNKYGDYVDVSRSTSPIAFKRLSQRTYIRDEQILRFELDFELKKETKYQLIIRTSAGVTEQKFKFNIKEADNSFIIETK